MRGDDLYLHEPGMPEIQHRFHWQAAAVHAASGTETGKEDPQDEVAVHLRVKKHGAVRGVQKRFLPDAQKWFREETGLPVQGMTLQPDGNRSAPAAGSARRAAGPWRARVRLPAASAL